MSDSLNPDTSFNDYFEIIGQKKLVMEECV